LAANFIELQKASRALSQKDFILFPFSLKIGFPFCVGQNLQSYSCARQQDWIWVKILSRATHKGIL